MDDQNKEKNVRTALKQQIEDSAGNIIYTYEAHWKIVNRLEGRFKRIKVVQIILTAISTGGFLASLVSGNPRLSWIGGATSAIALGLNLYMLSFNINNDIKDHTDAANELWDVREDYKSLLVDFELLDINKLRERRDKLQERVSHINHSFPGTDSKSFKETQKGLQDYIFEDGESEKLIHKK